MNANRVVIFIEGGCVQDVISDEQLDVAIVDRDVDSIGDTVNVLGSQAVISVFHTEPYFEADGINEVFKVYEENYE